MLKKISLIFVFILIQSSFKLYAQSISLTPNGVWVPSMTTTVRTSLTPTTGQLVYDSSLNLFYYYNGTAWVALSSTVADNLGNHIATQNINLGSNFISIDGSSKGISVSSDGSASIKTNSNNSPSFIAQSGYTPSYRIFQEQSGIYPSYSWDLGGNETVFFLKDVTNSNKLPLRVYAGQNTDRLVLRNNNVGIGVSNPSEALEVSGKTKTINFQMTNGATNGYILQSDANGIGMWVNSTTLSNGNWTSYGNNQFSALNGNVGIGTSTPSDKLQVEGNIDIKSGRLSFSNDYSSILIGATAGLANIADYNIFIGTEAGRNNINGEYNTFIGSFAGRYNTTAYHNTALGFGAFENNTTGGFNTALGFYALNKNTTGKENVAAGYGALKSNTTANFNTANGFWALQKNTTGENNVAVGYKSLEQNTTANYNAAFGFQALNQNIDGEENTALGTFALQNNISGSYNSAIGLNSLKQNTIGDDNVALGYEAGYGNIDGEGNTYIGHQSGYFNVHGSNNVFLGHDAGYNEIGSNKLYIANSSTPLIYGDFTNKNIGIGTSTIPTESTLVLGGSASTEGGQIQLNNADNKSTSYFLDTYNDDFRIMSGITSGSNLVRMQITSNGTGIGIPSPKSTLEVNGSFGAKIKSNLVVGTTNPDASATFWQYTTSTNTLSSITLPSASSCSSRMYTIINATNSEKSISNYIDLTNNTLNKISSTSSITIVSDGNNWIQVK